VVQTGNDENSSPAPNVEIREIERDAVRVNGKMNSSVSTYDFRGHFEEEGEE
jgi:hypothetical protein